MNFATDMVASLHRYAQPWSAQNRSKATRLPHAIMESYPRHPSALPRLLLQPQVGLFPCCLWRDASGPCPWTAKSGSDVGHGFILGLWCSCAPLFVLVLGPVDIEASPG